TSRRCAATAAPAASRFGATAELPG
ncbi:MAG: hypothetical protein JWM35_825, partial [Verrucomicrobia bacterium]|nr:hypothetical protein [Verrucomicrobiota bacterium]